MGVVVNTAASGGGAAGGGGGGGGGLTAAVTSTVVSGVTEIRNESNNPLIAIGSAAPSNADGRPDGTIYIQIAP